MSAAGDFGGARPEAGFRLTLVAQASKPAVSQVSKPAAGGNLQRVRARRRPADLEVGDPAGLETCATGTSPPRFAISGLTLMPFGNSNEESQRDSGLQPRVARNELPWEGGSTFDNPNGVAARRRTCAATPLGLKNFPVPTQGSSFLATLGWRTQPRWGCRELSNARLAAQRSSEWNYRKALGLTLLRF